MNSDEYDLLTECRPFHGKIDGVKFSLNYGSSIIQNLVQKSHSSPCLHARS